MFDSVASNLVPGDTNHFSDIFLYDRQSGAVVRVSTDVNGAQANLGSEFPSISADDRHVVFESDASNLAPNDSNGRTDIVMKDLLTGAVALVSVDSSGHQGTGESLRPSMSPDARYVVFQSASALAPGVPSGGTFHVYVHDMLTGTTDVDDVSSSGVLGNGDALNATISADGRYVAFVSYATNLGIVPSFAGAFVHDRQTGITTPLSGDGSNPYVSEDGHYVAFGTNAPQGSCWLHDLQSGTDTLVSVSTDGTMIPGGFPSLSADDRYVVFSAYLSGLASPAQLVVRDLQAGVTSTISVGPGGALGNADSEQGVGPQFSADDRYVSFVSAATNLVPSSPPFLNMFVGDRQTGAITQVDTSITGIAADGASSSPSLSPDARFVAFHSSATNLVDGDANGKSDVFLFDRQSQSLVCASVNGNGQQGNGDSAYPVCSNDGRYVAFVTDATNLFPGDANGLPDVVVKDMVTGGVTNASVDSNGAQGTINGIGGARISGDGRYVCFWSASHLVQGDSNSSRDVFLRDRQLGSTSLVSISSSGAQGNQDSDLPDMTPDARFIAFESSATNLVGGDTNDSQDVFVRDLQLGTTARVSVSSNGTQSNGLSGQPAISADGRYVAFLSAASNLVANDTNGVADVFVHDVITGETTRVDVGPNGAEADGPALGVAISRDGRFVAFVSDATNLVPGDTNGVADTFVYDRLTGIIERESVDSNGMQSNGASLAPNVAVSADGHFIALASTASNLAPNDANGVSDIFLRDRGPASAFVSLCFGDGTGAPCPCNNNGVPGHGCDNSSATGGAVLTASGVASLTTDTVQLTSSGEMPSSMSIVLQGNAFVPPVDFGNGLRCAGGTLKRLYTLNASGGALTVPPSGGLSISARSAAGGDVIPLGATRAYQVYYHDPNLAMCPNGFNVSNAIAVAWGS